MTQSTKPASGPGGRPAAWPQTQDDPRAAAEARYQDIAALGARILELEAGLQERDDHIARLMAELDRAQAGRIPPDQAELAIGELSRQLDLRDQTLADVTADRDRAHGMISEILGTTSWRATAPLRRIKGLLGGKKP
ncbi:MAG: hypothetical protein Q4G25_06320 [Paracoccus sp. (in: a-proteobacteria)]|nr:hypothetical protein [Paracoccus sp. (in: a-proteobacteria)]